MPKEYFNPKQLFPSLQYGFSQVVTSRGGKTVYMAGQVAWDAQQHIVGQGDLRAQTRQTFRNIRTAVEAAGGMMTDVVSLRIYIVADKMQESGPVKEALQEFFPDNPPVSTWIGVQTLANEDFLIEIEATAVIDP